MEALILCLVVVAVAVFLVLVVVVPVLAWVELVLARAACMMGLGREDTGEEEGPDAS